MSEHHPHPSDTIWFIRATEDAYPLSEGSAVAVRLRKKGNQGQFQNYLVTCAHVIRKKGSAPNTFGPCYAVIKAWSPGSGFNPAKGHDVAPVEEVHPLKTYATETFYWQPIEDMPNADWALLEFKRAPGNDERLPTAQIWTDENPPRGTACEIHGYPGGSAGFQGNDSAKSDIVRPSLPYGHQVATAAGNGIIEFQGSQSRPGMSGGGVFQKNGRSFVLLGLHRFRDDPTLQLHAVSAAQIRSVLESYGYEFSKPRRGQNAYLWMVPVVLFAITIVCILVAILTGVFPDGKEQPPRINSSEFLANFETKSATLSPDQFTSLLRATANPETAHFNFGRLAIVSVSDARNGDGNWVFTVVPLDCVYVARSRGEFRVEVSPDVLPDGFHYSTYMPTSDNYRVVEITARIKQVFWLAGRPKGTILLGTTGFHDTGETVSCRPK